MPKIANYAKNESLATGFVRPKVTALFFDKLWIPESLLNSSYEYIIPDEVLVKEETELIISKMKKKLAGNYYFAEIQRNHPVRNYPITGGKFYQLLQQANVGVSVEDSRTIDDPYEIKFKYSKNRNNAIMVNAESFYKKYGLYISPIYHNLTEFERDIKSSPVRPKSFFKKAATLLSNKEAVAICIEDFPSIVEEELSWEQVLEIRKDKKSIKQLKQFTTWTKRTFPTQSPDEIRDIIASEIDEYKQIIKEYHIRTAVGSFSTLVSSASSIATLLVNQNIPLLPTLALMTVPISFLVDHHFLNLKKANNPIAYLYNIEQKC